MGLKGDKPYLYLKLGKLSGNYQKNIEISLASRRKSFLAFYFDYKIYKTVLIRPLLTKSVIFRTIYVENG